MTLVRNTVVVLIVTWYASTFGVLKAQSYYCSDICGASASCDQECIDTYASTCGTYNGGYSGGMCAGTQPRCSYTVVFSNAYRKITGSVNAECPGFFGDIHSPPWSNFGLETPYCSRQDSDQFAGWQDLNEGHLEWNACTDGHGDDFWIGYYDYRAANSLYYNADDFTTQESDAAHWYGYAPLDTAGSCFSQLDGQVFSVDGTYTTVWDLDENWSDEELQTLTFPGADILMTCDSGDDTCVGESDWMDPTSGDNNFTSKLKVSVYASGYLGE